MGKLLAVLMLIAVVVLIVVIGPILTIWAFNTLFPAVAVPYDIYSWFAVIILGAFFRANVSIKKAKD